MAKPLKRFPALQPISRQHHKVLQCCFKVRKGVASGIKSNRVLDYIQYFWQDYYLKHTRFQIDSLDGVLTKEQSALLENREEDLAILYERLQAVDKKLLEFEKALYTHVRWEERVLFEAIQDEFENSDLEVLLIQKNDLSDWCEVYQDQFWL